MTERLHFHFSLSCIGDGNGSPLQCSCLENPRDGEAWWAAVYGVAQSQTHLKQQQQQVKREALFLGYAVSRECLQLEDLTQAGLAVLCLAFGKEYRLRKVLWQDGPNKGFRL